MATDSTLTVLVTGSTRAVMATGSTRSVMATESTHAIKTTNTTLDVRKTVTPAPDIPPVLSTETLALRTIVCVGIILLLLALIIVLRRKYNESTKRKGIAQMKSVTDTQTTETGDTEYSVIENLVYDNPSIFIETENIAHNKEIYSIICRQNNERNNAVRTVTKSEIYANVHDIQKGLNTNRVDSKIQKPERQHLKNESSLVPEDIYANIKKNYECDKDDTKTNSDEALFPKKGSKGLVDAKHAKGDDVYNHLRRTKRSRQTHKNEDEYSHLHEYNEHYSVPIRDETHNTLYSQTERGNSKSQTKNNLYNQSKTRNNEQDEETVYSISTTPMYHNSHQESIYINY